MSKINFGCGTNRLVGWENVDNEVDISKPLPYASGPATAIFAEHVVEHIPYYEAIEFFKECRRVLKPGGVLRIAVPSLERVMLKADDEYCRFTQKWQNVGATKRGAMHAILYAHGHKTAWTEGLLLATLYYAGFDATRMCRPRESGASELRNLEGHHTVIGPKFNDIETVVCEGVK